MVKRLKQQVKNAAIKNEEVNDEINDKPVVGQVFDEWIWRMNGEKIIITLFSLRDSKMNTKKFCYWFSEQMKWIDKWMNE